MGGKRKWKVKIIRILEITTEVLEIVLEVIVETKVLEVQEMKKVQELIERLVNLSIIIKEVMTKYDFLFFI